MPMEQARGDARPASDLYALGVTMVVALAGRPPAELPFDDATGKIAIGRALSPETPAALAAVLDAMVAPLLGQRIQSAEEALSRLDAAREARPPAEPPPPAARPGPAGMHHRLVVVVGPNLGEELVLLGARMTIGRTDAATFAIAHNSLSRLHCELTARGAGRFEIVDLGSSNGVRINGVAVNRAILEAGDIVELGAVKLRFDAGGERSRPDESRDLPVSAVVPPTRRTKTPLVVAAVVAAGVALAIGGSMLGRCG